MTESSGSSPDTAFPGAAVTDSPSRGRRVPGRAVIAALVLVLAIILAAALVQIPALRPFPVPITADDISQLPAPAGRATGLTPDPAGPDITADASSSRTLAITTFGPPVSSRMNRSPGSLLITSEDDSTLYPASATTVDARRAGSDTTLLGINVHEEVNRVRQEHGVPILGTDGGLASVARAHSRDMASHGYFGHVNLREWDATARGAAAGYVCYHADSSLSYPVSENLFAMYRYDTVMAGEKEIAYRTNTDEEIAEAAVTGWLNSPDHRRNLLDTSITRQGIGVAVGEGELVFITQNMC